MTATERPVVKLNRGQEAAMNVLMSDATHIVLFGGGRSGKTWLLVRAVIIRALRTPNTHHAIFRFRFNHVKSSVILKTFPDVMRMCFPDLEGKYRLDKTDWYVKFPNGSEIWFGGLDSGDRTEKILGNEYSTIYFNECSQIPYASILTALTRLAEKSDLLNRAYYDFNPPSKAHWTHKLFIEKVDPITNKPVPHPEDYTHYIINPMDNVENLSPTFLRLLESMPQAQRDRFLLGKFADTDLSSLWDVNILDAMRKTGIPEGVQFPRVVVAVDPSGSRGEDDLKSDEIGIVTAALGSDNHGYLLEDLSGRYRSEKWAEIAVDAYQRNKADAIVAERNFGGDMVRGMIHSVDPTVNVIEVTASRGKIVRAEPIASLYHKGLIHHVGTFQELEDQMTNMSRKGYLGLGSPDRLDALVWAFHELFESIAERTGSEAVLPGVNTPMVIGPPRSATDWRPSAGRRGRKHIRVMRGGY